MIPNPQITGPPNKVPAPQMPFLEAQSTTAVQRTTHHPLPQPTIAAKTTVAYVGPSMQSALPAQFSVARHDVVPGEVIASIKQEPQTFPQNLGTTIVRSNVNTLSRNSIPLSTSPLAPGRLSIAGEKQYIYILYILHVL